jgi:hypothetical protein
VLFFSAGVGEAEVNELDFVLLHHLHHVCDALGHQGSPNWMVVENLDGSGNAVSVPKLVHDRIGRAARLSSIFNDFPYTKLAVEQALAPSWCPKLKCPNLVRIG